MKTKFKSQRKGAVLATVTVVSVMMIVIIMAATQLVSHTSARTNKEYRKKQAYYVASSCLRAFVSQTTGMSKDANNTPAEIMAQIKQLKDIAASNEEVTVQIRKHGTTQGVGDSQPRWNNATCTLKVEQNGSENNLKVIATGTYLGQTKKVVAYLYCETMQKHKFKPKALEIISTDGGTTVRPYFENLRVYGATGTTSEAAHTQNVLYNFNHNVNELYGEVDINGSMSLQNNNRFWSNPYYCEGVDDSMGCVLNVSRSLIFVANTPGFYPSFEKDLFNQDLNPQLDKNNYNYINVRDALVLSSEGATIGSDEKKVVDTYAGLIFIGQGSDIDDNLRLTIAKKDFVNDTTADVDAFWGTENGVQSYQALGTGANNEFYGNIYTYRDNDVFNGDIMIYNGTKVHGNIYVDGDLYYQKISGSFSANAIYLSPNSKIYKDKRKTNADGTADTSSLVEFTGNELDGIPIHRGENWKSNARANRPIFNQIKNPTPYYYYPEHLLCLPGEKNTVSTIHSQYKAMYTNDEDGKQWKLDTANVPSIVADEFKNNAKQEFTAEDGSGGLYRPDYIVTKDCYLGTTDGSKIDGKKILIDMDSCPNKNLVVVLKDDGGSSCVMNDNFILVKNHTDPNSADAKFVYFVSDSGVGDVEDTYAKDGKSESWYDPNSFKKSTFTFGGAKNVIMDLETFLHSNVFDADGAKGNGGSLNPTEYEKNGGYMLDPNNIIFLICERSKLVVDEAETILQASVYMPRATYENSNRGRGVSIEPYSKQKMNSKMEAVAIIGNLVCNHYNIVKGNNHAIVYNDLSPYSMLATVKGFGEEQAEESFTLHHYAAS